MSIAKASKKVMIHEETPMISTSFATRAWFILACGWAFYLYEYVLRASPSVITDMLMADFKVTATALGTLTSFYYFSYVPLQVPGGIIVDNFGPRKVVTVSTVICVLGAILFSQSDSLFMAQMGRFLIGIGSACAYISCMKIAAEWFPVSKFAFIAGVSMMMGTIGGVSGGKPFALLANSVGWRNAMLIAAVVGVIVAIISWIVIRDRPKGKHKQKHGEKLFDGLKVIVSKPQNWLIGLYGLVMFLPLSAFAELWGVPYLMQRYNIANDVASHGSIMVFVGMAIGCFMSAKVSDYFQSRKKVMSLSVAGTFVGFLMVLYVPNLSYNMVLALLLVTGVIAGLSILYFPAAKESNPVAISGTVIGFTNALVMVSGVIFQPLLGALIDYSWDGSYTHDGIRAYSYQDYHFALSVMVFTLLIGRVLVYFLRETYTTEEN